MMKPWRFGVVALVYLLLAPVASVATPIAQPSSGASNGTIPSVALGSLPSCTSGIAGREYWVTGLTSTAACSGSGSAATACLCNGSSWTPRGSGGSSNSFATISTTSGTAPVASSPTDTLTLSAGTGITVTGSSGAKSATIAATLGVAVDPGEMANADFGGFTCASGVCTADAGSITSAMLAGSIDPLKLSPGTVTATELGYVHNVTSAIQTQLNAKLSTSGGSVTGTVTFDGTHTITGLPVSAAASDAVTRQELIPGTTYLARDGSQPPTADQPMNSFTLTGTRNGTDGSTEAANMVNVVAARGPSSLLGWPTFARQDCQDSTGTCPSPTGAIVIDPWIGWVKSPGQRRDDNSSMWSTVNGIGSQTADAATDFINQQAPFTITGAGGTQYTTTVDLAGSTNGADKWFCRCSTSPYAPADTDGSCTTNGGGTSTVQPTSSHYEAIIFKHGSRYLFASVTSYNGCNASPSTVTLGSRLPVAISTGDSFQYATPDGIHPDTYYYRWLAQNILEARWEATYWPKVNLLGGDEIKNGVTQNALGESCTNWTKTSGSAGSISTGSFPATPAGGGFLNSVRGSSCYLSSARAAGDSIRTPAATVEPGKVYAFHGWVRMNSGNGGDTNTVRVRPFNASGDTILGSTEFKTFWINGYDAPPVQWSSTGDSGHEVCSEWCYVVVLVKPATATSIYIDINGQTSTANIMGDEWVGFPSMYEQLDLHYVFPDAGNQSWWVHTDSRGLDANAYGDGSGNKERINKALDTMQPLVRPLMTFSKTMATRNTSNSGHSLATDIALAGFSANRPQFGLIHLGVNDAGSYSSANLVTAVQNTVKDGTIPVLILEGAYRGDTSDTTACGGTNCTNVFMGAEKTFLQQGNAN